MRPAIEGWRGTASGSAAIRRAVSECVEALSPKADAITLEARRVALRRQVEDVLLEALYAVERKAMSPRLSRYAQDQRTR